MKQYDQIIIGSGPAVYRLLVSLRKNGNKGKAVVIEKGDFGGTCPNAGCEPKIFLEGTIRTVLTSRRLTGKGLDAPAKLNWTELIKRKKQVFAPFSPNAIKTYESLGADTIHGEASFVDAHTITVNGEKLTGKQIILATGHRPRILTFPGSEYTLTNYDVFNMEKLPKRVGIIGSGYVGMEIAVLLATAGAKVTMLQRSDRPLRAFYSKHVQQLVDEMEQNLGVVFDFNTHVQKIEKEADHYQVTTQEGQQLAFDAVLNASGRVPNVESLHLEKAGIKQDAHGIIIDSHLQTNVENIFAIGDVNKKNVPALTPTAEFEGNYLGQYLTGKRQDDISYPVVGTTVFAFPEIAEAGVKIDDALKDDRYTVQSINIAEGDYLYAGTDDEEAKLALVFDKEKHLVGASEISQTAVDDINNLIPVIALDLPAETWQEKMIVAFPSLAYKIKSLF